MYPCAMQATIYRCLPCGDFEVVQIYVDDDVSLRSCIHTRVSLPAQHGTATQCIRTLASLCAQHDIATQF